MSMRKIVLDIGSGASLPDVSTAKSVVETIARANTGKHQVVLKPQLFQNIPPNKPLRPRLAEEIATLCLGNSLGYAVSVFDRVSLDWALEMHDVSPLDHIKIACRPDLYWLAGEIPRKIPVHMSFDCRTQTSLDLPWKVDVALGCVPEYPASLYDYSSTLFRGYEQAKFTYPRQLKRARKYRGSSQLEMAELLGKHVTTYGKWELGKNEPNSSEVAAIARILCLRVDYFYSDRDPAAFDEARESGPSADVEYYARIVQGLSMRRQLVRIASQLVADSHEDSVAEDFHWLDVRRLLRAISDWDDLSYSDHTVGLDIWKLNKPSVWEKHFVMQADDPSNPDSVGGFALTPADLKDVL
jgi:transcriptional regulator with XRE-family HTH domain